MICMKIKLKNEWKKLVYFRVWTSKVNKYMLHMYQLKDYKRKPILKIISVLKTFSLKIRFYKN